MHPSRSHRNAGAVGSLENHVIGLLPHVISVLSVILPAVGAGSIGAAYGAVRAAVLAGGIACEMGRGLGGKATGRAASCRPSPISHTPCWRLQEERGSKRREWASNNFGACGLLLRDSRAALTFSWIVECQGKQEDGQSRTNTRPAHLASFTLLRDLQQVLGAGWCKRRAFFMQ
jgi:hypothetical protein